MLFLLSVLPLICLALTGYLLYVKKEKNLSWLQVFSPLITLLVIKLCLFAYILYFISRLG
jgi:hypothetical protein